MHADILFDETHIIIIIIVVDIVIIVVVFASDLGSSSHTEFPH